MRRAGHRDPRAPRDHVACSLVRTICWGWLLGRGLYAGFSDVERLLAFTAIKFTTPDYAPVIDEKQAGRDYAGWQSAVRQVLVAG